MTEPYVSESYRQYLLYAPSDSALRNLHSIKQNVYVLSVFKTKARKQQTEWKGVRVSERC